ncbi:hypothetical protein Q8W40_24370 [Vibrio penaeicida]|uniref:hypothetical protein n=1 Tax=Vibrio penaeicida TaxID=104609 RepID=UPI00273604A4|nr:hypothetical protein [Vibrio penaeicida]MDP2575354.1 hypothetical protein [Vibrio penaeicida]
MINNKDILNKFSFVIAALAFLVTSYGVWEQVRDKNPEIKVSTIVQDKVTDLANIKGLVASYSFNGESIKDLWKVKVRLQNVGEKTIIGKGSKSDLIKGVLEFSFPKGFRIIDLDETKDLVRAKLETYDSNSFYVEFDQWQSEEYIDVELFLEQMDSSPKSPKIMLASRSLIDGNFNLSKENPLDVVKQKSLLNLPTPLVELSSTFVAYSKSLLFVLLLYIVTAGLKDCLIYFQWKKMHKANFDAHVDQLFSDFDEEKFKDICKLYKDDPNKAPDWVWEEFSDERVSGTALFATTRPTVVFFIVSWLFVLATVVSVVG